MARRVVVVAICGVTLPETVILTTFTWYFKSAVTGSIIQLCAGTTEGLKDFLQYQKTKKRWNATVRTDVGLKHLSEGAQQ